MDKMEMVKRFYERGVLPSAKELEAVPGGCAGPLPGNAGLSVTAAPCGKSKKLSPQDIINYYNSKYEKIKGMLLKKTDAISITNAKAGPGPCSIIGIVKGMTQLGFMFEDPTGEIEVVKSGMGGLEMAKPDDVFGLSGLVRENRFFPKEIAWPGIPLNHHIGRIAGASMALSGSPLEIRVSDGSTAKSIKIGETPEWITISRGQDRFLVLAFMAGSTTREEAAHYLERRSLPEPSPIRTTEPSCLIGEIPDILWLIQEGNWSENYKGITIISCGPNSSTGVDLGTREVIFEKAQHLDAVPSVPSVR